MTSAFLTHCTCACALGRTNAEVLEGLRRGVSPLVPLTGDIPGRTVLFGSVPGELPAIADPVFDCRSCRLLDLALDSSEGVFANLVARYGADRVAVVLGASNTGVHEAQAFVEEWLATGVKPEAFRSSLLELGTPVTYLAQRLGVTGPAYTVSTACSSAAKALASARRLLETGACDAAITGGVDGRCRFALNGFHALGALSEGLARPFAPDRDGINLGEGVALFALERADRLTPDAARIRLAGCGESSDAHHPTAPDPEGRGAEAAMRAALADAGLAPAAVTYVNFHGTGTPANDAMEAKAVRRVFGRTDLGESTKPLTGHCLGAAGAVEAAVCWLKLAAGEVTGAALSNSFAFGGSNASVILQREDA